MNKKSKKQKAKTQRANQQAIRKTRNISNLITVLILGGIGFFVYPDVLRALGL